MARRDYQSIYSVFHYIMNYFILLGKTNYLYLNKNIFQKASKLDDSCKKCMNAIHLNNNCSLYEKSYNTAWINKWFIAGVSITQHSVYFSILNLDFGVVCQM